MCSRSLAQKEWNGRLQAPREQLERLAKHLEKRGLDLDRRDSWDKRSLAMWRNLRWFLTFSVKLRPAGPWLDYVDAGLPKGWEYRKSRSGDYYLNIDANAGRKGRARIKLARLPGLRVLSVDLGHRYAAACAVWETLSREQMEAACRSAEHAPPAPDEIVCIAQAAHRETPKFRPAQRTARRGIDDLSADRAIRSPMVRRIRRRGLAWTGSSSSSCKGKSRGTRSN